MGYKQADIDRKVNEVFNDVFYGKNKVYFEVGDSMGNQPQGLPLSLRR